MSLWKFIVTRLKITTLYKLDNDSSQNKCKFKIVIKFIRSTSIVL